MRTRPFRYFLALAIVLAITTIARAAPNNPLPVGSRFPHFSLIDKDGERWDLADHNDQPKVVMFWATWCPYWRRLFPAVVALQKKYAGNDVQMVAVNFDDGGDVQQYADVMGITFPILMKGDGLASAMGIASTPAVYFLDTSNRVTYFHSDSDPNDPRLERAILQIISRTGDEDK